ncbi:MAG TPA: single-stranded DNA-binding protein, partial [Methylococcaceae bacterium]|nr:single-stranded DNA-binding protein [Methylococcaceae bacterium]
MLNKVTLIGNLGQDPDVRTSPNGTKIVRISLATTRRWTDR